MGAAVKRDAARKASRVPVHRRRNTHKTVTLLKQC
jgi:hypothetical protein